MFIFDKAPFASCHASTLVEPKPGRLMAAWFGGKDEGAKDVQIWAASFDGAKWTPPQVLGGQPGQPCWNPVLFQIPGGPLLLWYKAGLNPMTWVGYLRRSTDGGATWSAAEVMPAGFFGPVRAKPIRLADGTILAGTSVEAGDGKGYRVWTPYVDRSTDGGATWTRSNAYNLPGKHGQIQPTLFEGAGGKIVALTRSRDPLKVCRAESADGGKTFTPAATVDLPNPSSGIDAVRLADGSVILIYNPTTSPRFPLSLARSTDDGLTWKKLTDLETQVGEFSYPAMILGSDGKLHMTYTWNRTHVKYVTADPGKLG